MDFYNFFSMSGKKAIYRASEICGQFNNQYLEPEHIFYSVMNLRTCSAVQVLHQLGVNLPKLTYSLEARLYEHAGTYKGNPVFSQRTIQLLDEAYKEVTRLHHREIGTTHLLIALTRDKGNFLRNLFDEHGVNAEKIRDTFLTHLKGYDAQDVDLATSVGDPDPRYRSAGPVPGLYDTSAAFILRSAMHCARHYGRAEARPVHLLYGACIEPGALHLLGDAGYQPAQLIDPLATSFRAESGEWATEPQEPRWSEAACDVLGRAYAHCMLRGGLEITAADLLCALAKSDNVELSALLDTEPAARRAIRDLRESSGPEPELG